MSQAKRKGTRNEHRSKVILEATGYAVCHARKLVHRWRRVLDVRQV